MARAHTFADEAEWDRALRAAFAAADSGTTVVSDRVLFGGDQDMEMAAGSTPMRFQEEDTEMFDVIFGRMIDDGSFLLPVFAPYAEIRVASRVRHIYFYLTLYAGWGLGGNARQVGCIGSRVALDDGSRGGIKRERGRARTRITPSLLHSQLSPERSGANR
jgi:hypothetical protein